MPDQHDPFPNCAVCGRTILKGEQAHEYVNPQGQRLGVCVLCRSRAESSGWVAAELAGSGTYAPPSRARRGEALRKRLERAASRARSSARGGRRDPPSTEASAEKNGAPGQSATQQRAKPKPRAQPKREPAPQPAGEAAPKKPRPRRGPEALMRRAVERFNGSDECRKVAGLVRSLGEPRAAVRPDAGRQMALVTVAWEISWYQWEVSADGHDEPVREVAKGDDVSELAEEARAWNAAVTDDGTLRLQPASSGRKASGKKA